MKRFRKMLELSGMLILLPFLIVLFHIFPLYRYLNVNWMLFELLILAASCLIITGVFFKYIKSGILIRSFSGKALLVAIVFAFFIHEMSVLIEQNGDSEIILQKKNFQFLYVLLVSIIIPILEEIVCRIIIINRFKDRIHPLVLIVSSSLLFALLHMRDIRFFISSLFFGIILASLYMLSKNGVLLILVHIIYNSVYLLLNSILIEVHQKVVLYYNSIWHYALVSLGILILLYLFVKKPAFFMNAIVSTKSK